MKKYTSSIAFLALAAFLAFFAACGEGEPVDLNGSSDWGKIQNAMDEFTGDNGPIAKCAEEGCLSMPVVQSSSSSDNTGTTDDSSSSSYDDSGNGDGSSNSDEEEPSSSSRGTPAAAGEENCEEGSDIQKEIQAKFDCRWDPDDVITSGDNATLRMDVKDPTCTIGKAWLEVEMAGGTRYGTVGFTVNEEVQTSGSYKDIIDNGTLKDPPNGQLRAALWSMACLNAASLRVQRNARLWR